MPDWKRYIQEHLSSGEMSVELEPEIVEEMAQHLEDRYQELLVQGVTENEAERVLLVSLQESGRSAREPKPDEASARKASILSRVARLLWVRILEPLWQDLRYGARQLRRSPGFALTSVLILALAIGANAAIFSVIEGVMLRPLPYKDVDRLAVLWKTAPAKSIAWDWTSYLTIRDWREQNRSFEALAFMLRPEGSEFLLSSTDGPEKVQGSVVSGNFFDVLGATPLIGRAFGEREAIRREDVIVLSHGFWMRRYGGDPNVLGRSLRFGERNPVIIGVMPLEFQYPDRTAQFWSLITADARWSSGFQKYRIADAFCAIGRLRRGVSIRDAQVEMDAIAGRLAQDYPATDAHLGVWVEPIRDRIARPEIKRALWILGGAVLCVLLIAAANIAGLSVARGAARRRDLAIRAALGAGRSRLLRQLATEHLMLCLIGGATGLIFAFAALHSLLARAPVDLPRTDEIAVNGRVALFTFALCLLTGVIFGLLPAAQILRGNLLESLAESDRTASGPGVQRLRAALVAAQFGLAIVLLTGAGLLVRSFLLLDAIPLGFDPTHLLSATFQLPEQRYQKDPQSLAFQSEAIEQLQRLPGVRGAAVGAAGFKSFRGHVPNQNLVIEGRPAEQDPARHGRDVVSDDYFRVMRIPLLQGRLFSGEDNAGAPGVAVINEAMARRYWPAGSPLGKRFKQVLPGTDGPWLTVIGVVGNVMLNRDGDVIPNFYHSIRQWPFPQMNLLLRTEELTPELATAVRQTLGRIEPAVSNIVLQPVEQSRDRVDRPRRFQLELLGGFAVAALMLAALGLYGLMSYLVRQRTKEIGVRMALGATAGDILRLVIRQGMVMTLTGIAIGLVGAFALTRVLRSLLYGVNATDPMTFVAVTLGLGLIALIACFGPAWRATKVDPIKALKYE
jgi:putative ABC transport system permease protein